MNAKRTLPFTTAILFALALPVCAIDADGDGLNDVWEIIYNAQSLTAAGDADGDGTSNAKESSAGTDPFSATSSPALSLAPSAPGQFQLGYQRVPGKRYRIESSLNLALNDWFTDSTDIAHQAGPVSMLMPAAGPSKFWRLKIDDVDSDADGANDAEERWLGFNPSSNRTDRNDTLDLARINAGLNASSTVTVSVLDAVLSERWPDPALIVVRRSGGLKPLTVSLAFGGTATSATDYTSSATTSVFFAAGVREVPIVLTPIADADDAEASESIIVTALAGTGYSLGATTSGTIILENETA